MKMLKTTAAIWIAGAVWIASDVANAYGDGTPDAQPPAEEETCDGAGLFGSAYGLCVAFCEANDCDMQADPSDPACSVLRDRYAKVTGETWFPCEAEEGEAE